MAIEHIIKAKREKNDEFYTQYADIQKEVNAYIEYNPDVFKGKTILLPCDDPEWSNFTKFFAQNFDRFGLKKLISTSYSLNKKQKKYNFSYQLSLFETESPQFDEEKTKTHGKIFTLDSDLNHSGKVDINDLKWDYLEGDGDFRSNEVKKLRDEADIIITNPPFSLFNEFVSWIYEANKLFLIIGNGNNATYKEIFKLIKENKLWLGAVCDGKDMVFEVPEGASVSPADKEKAAKLGYVGNYTRMGNCCWFTNLEHGRRHQKLELMTMKDNLKYSKHKKLINQGYIKYDNYDAIEIPFTDSIPCDYDGLMGVPPSFLEKYNPEQFKIVACSQTGCHPDSMILRTYKDYVGYKQDGRKTGRTGSTCGHNPMLLMNDGIHDYYKNEEGRIVQSGSSRIFIQKIKEENDENNIEN